MRLSTVLETGATAKYRLPIRSAGRPFSPALMRGRRHPFIGALMNKITYMTRKRLLALLSASVVTLTVLSVGKAAAQNQEPTKLVIANSQWLDALRGKKLWSALQEYQKFAPNVVLEQEAIPSAQFDTRLTTELAARQGPDIAMMLEPLLYALADGGLLSDLSSVTESDTKLNNTNENGKIDGVQMGIAWQRAVYALIYNKTLLAAGNANVPTNVDELISSAQGVMDATGAVGFLSRHQIADFGVWSLDFQNWAFGYGVNWVDANGRLTIDTPEALEAFTAFKRMYDAKIIPFGDDMPTQRNRFKQQQAALSIDNSGGALNIATGGPLPSMDLRAAPLPFPYPGAHNQFFVGVSAHSKNKQAAFEFLKWMIGPEGQKALREASGPDTLATDVPIDPDFEKLNPWATTFGELAKTSRSTLIPGYEVETNSIMRIVMEGLEKVINSDADPKAVLAEAQKLVDQRF